MDITAILKYLLGYIVVLINFKLSITKKSPIINISCAMKIIKKQYYSNTILKYIHSNKLKQLNISIKIAGVKLSHLLVSKVQICTITII